MAQLRFTLSVFAILAMSAATSAQRRLPVDLPQSRAELGNAFVSAWTAFRQNLDAMGGKNIHPMRISNWFARMPRFLAEDAARFATDPQVILSAAVRLAAMGTKRDQRFLAELCTLHTEGTLSRSLLALRIRSGDRALRQQMKRRLKTEHTQQKIEAAAILAEAQDKQGRNFLLDLVRKREKGFAASARLLGYLGSDAEDRILAEAMDRDPKNTVLAAARGEIALRRYFPHHYSMILRFKLAGPKVDIDTSMHDTWLIVADQAIQDGARTSAAVMNAALKMRPSPVVQLDPETWHRQIAAFKDFWLDVDRLNKNYSKNNSAWPKSFKEAVKFVPSSPSGHRATGSDFERAISALISVCAWTAKRLDHDRLARVTPGLKVLTPGGNRAIDGNLGTAWHAERDDAIVLEHDEMDKATALWLTNGCPFDRGSRIKEVQLTTGQPGEDWIAVEKLDTETAYFQKIPLKNLPAKRLAVKITQTSQPAPVCIAEMRIEY